MKDRVYGHGTTTSMLGSPVDSKVAKLKEEKAKEKEKAKMDSKELMKHTLAKNKHRTQNGGQKKIVVRRSRVKKGKKGSSEGKNYFSESDFRACQPAKSTSNNSTHAKEETKMRKEKARTMPIILNHDFQSWKHLMKKDMVILGNQTIGILA